MSLFLALSDRERELIGLPLKNTYDTQTDAHSFLENRGHGEGIHRAAQSAPTSVRPTPPGLPALHISLGLASNAGVLQKENILRDSGTK